MLPSNKKLVLPSARSLMIACELVSGTQAIPPQTQASFQLPMPTQVQIPMQISAPPTVKQEPGALSTNETIIGLQEEVTLKHQLIATQEAALASKYEELEILNAMAPTSVNPQFHAMSITLLAQQIQALLTNIKKLEDEANAISKKIRKTISNEHKAQNPTAAVKPERKSYPQNKAARSNNNSTLNPLITSTAGQGITAAAALYALATQASNNNSNSNNSNNSNSNTNQSSQYKSFSWH